MDKNIKCDLKFCDQYCLCCSNCMRRNTRQFRWIKILSAILNFVISIVLICYIEPYEAQHPPVQMDKNIECDLKFCDQYCLCCSNCMRRNTRQFRWIKILSAILNFVISIVLICYIEPYEAQHPPVQMDKNIECDLKFCDQYCLCYIELYEAQHPPVQMDKNIKCYLNSVISTGYVTSNCMRRNTRQFRWIKILNSVISTVYVTSNCMRCNTRQLRWTKILSAILIL